MDCPFCGLLFIKYAWFDIPLKIPSFPHMNVFEDCESTKCGATRHQRRQRAL